MKNLKKYREVIIILILSIFNLTTGLITDNIIPWSIAAGWSAISAFNEYTIINMRDSIESLKDKIKKGLEI